MTSPPLFQYKVHLVVLHLRPIFTTLHPPLLKLSDQIKWQRVQHSQVSSSALLLVSSLFSFPSHLRPGIPSTSSTPVQGGTELASVCSVILVPAPTLAITSRLPSTATSQSFFSRFPFPLIPQVFACADTIDPSDGRLSSGTIHNLTFTLILHPIG